MKALVVYYTQSGNTKLIAEAIHSAIKDSTEADIKKLKDVKPNDLENYDIVFVGSPCHHADIVKKVSKFLSKIPKQSKFKLAGFITHACLPKEVGGKYGAMFERWVGKSEKSFETIATENELNYIGFFRCMGSATKPIEGFIHRQIITDKKEFEEYLVDLKKRPNEEDLVNAKEFAKKMIKG